MSKNNGTSENEWFDVVLARYGEIGIKSRKTRGYFEKILLDNIDAMLSLRSIASEGLEKEQGVVWAHTDDSRAARAIADVFGVVSSSPALSVEPDIESLCDAAVMLAGKFMDRDQSFAVRSKRVGDMAFSSRDIAVRAGDAVREGVADLNPRVDLDNPDLEIFLEARGERGFAYVEKVAGVGGMPVGTQGRMVSLLSGGIDSPVATWLMMKRGCPQVFLYLNNQPFSGESTRQRALDCIERLREWAPGRRMLTYEVPYGNVMERFLREENHRYGCVFCRRFMYRVAELVARRERAHGIITGSSLGQVASQTSQNMLAESRGIEYPLYHPLIGMDKSEITAMARRIGTFDISTRPAICCKAVPRYPVIRADVDALVEMESRLELEELARKAVREAIISR